MPSKTKSNAKSSFLRGINMFYYKIKIKYNNSRISACGFSKKNSGGQCLPAGGQKKRKAKKGQVGNSRRKNAESRQKRRKIERAYKKGQGKGICDPRRNFNLLSEH